MLSYADALRYLACRPVSPLGGPSVRAARLGLYIAAAPQKALPAKPESHDCPRCGGTGILPQFFHVENGVCFRCDGKGSAKSRPLPPARKATPVKGFVQRYWEAYT